MAAIQNADGGWGGVAPAMITHATAARSTRRKPLGRSGLIAGGDTTSRSLQRHQYLPETSYPGDWVKNWPLAPVFQSLLLELPFIILLPLLALAEFSGS
jgi:hypothetical protein